MQQLPSRMVTFNGTTNISGNTTQSGSIEIDNLKLDENVLSTINSIRIDY